MLNKLIPPTAFRVKLHTSNKVNERIKEKTLSSMSKCSEKGEEEISKRIDELNREWDTERILETSAAGLMLLGSTLALVTGKKRFAVFTGTIGAFLFQHALQGWCPPLPVIRRLGIRTSSEIHGEKYYLKYIRGDFDKWRGK